MDDNGPRRQLAERLRDNPMLADFLSPLPRLTEPGKEGDLGRTFERLGEIAGGSEVRARVHFRILEDDGETTRSWSLELGPAGHSVTPEPVHRPDLEVLVTEEAWRRLAEGTVSPLEAFGLGGMRVRGNVRVARRLVRLLRQQ
jgi:hypothetical protein